MKDQLPLLSFLTADEEPPEREYQNLYSQIVQTPGLLSAITRKTHTTELLYGISKHHHRLARILRRLFSVQNQLSKDFPIQLITKYANALLEQAARILHQVNIQGLVDILIPALSNCLTVNTDSGRSLGSVISRCGVIQSITTHVAGAQAIKTWTQSSSIFRQEAATLAILMEDLMSLIKNCCGDHGLASEANSWENLKSLKVLLGDLQHEQAATSAISSESQQLASAAARGRLLHRDEKKSSNAQQRPAQDSHIDLSPKIMDLLQSLELSIPTTSEQLKDVVTSLEYEKTIAILRAVAQSFPCNLCGVQLQASVADARNTDASLASHIVLRSRFDMTIFGQNVGDWELLLSTPAFAALRSMQRAGSSAKIERKLENLANGRGHMAPLAGSRIVRRRLRVPVFKSRCGRDFSILWQIDIDQVYQSNEQQSFRQVIRVWSIVQSSKIHDVVQNIAIIQSRWPAELIECCHKWLGSKIERCPFIITCGSGDSIARLRKHIGSDIRSMHQDILQLVDKFYPFTEAVRKKWTTRSMALEYPYKLSHQEIEIVRHHETASLILGRSGTGKTTCLMFRLIGRYLQSMSVAGERPIRQVLLTRSPTLASNLRIYVRNCIATLGLGADENSTVKERRMTEVSFNNISFPYVCTWEEFLQLLEDASSTIDGGTSHETSSSQQLANQDGNRAPVMKEEERCVDFTMFKLEYWPHLSSDLTKHLSLPLVFSEIMGVIKGSIVSGTTFRPLTLEEYSQRSSRVAPAFSHEADRAQVYKVFERYEALKREYQHCDFVDRVIHVLRALRTNPVLKRILRSMLDELYIDEVQDQRATDLKLLLNLVKDSRFFHVAGDTAQAISQESTFRFEDVKALIHDHFQDERPRGGQSQPTHPQMYTLGFNYRSRQGIVDLASFIMELLWKTFPDTVDKLDSEVGQLKGPKPILFLGCQQDTLANVHFDSSELSASTACFGADQVILVRDELTKEYLRSVIGVSGLILTILQSKGMEFDDVMIWNFFSTCLDTTGLRKLPTLFGSEGDNFDGRRHVGMCTELKHLYVAVTRARNRLFFLETSHQSVLSRLVELLTVSPSQALVQVVSQDDATFKNQLELLRAGSSSSPESWIRRGENFMSEEQYEEAFHCFQQAEDRRGMTLASAKRNVANGRLHRARGDVHDATKAFKDAIELFLSIEYTSEAIDLCCMIDWFQRAAEELSMKQDDIPRAATLFCEAKMYTKAADCYSKMKEYEQGAAMLWNVHEYNILVWFLTGNRESIQEELLQHYGALLKFLLKQGRIREDQRVQAITLLGSPIEREQVLRQLEMHEALTDMFCEEKKYGEAFDVCLQVGNLERALHLVRAEKFDVRPGDQREAQALHLLDYSVLSQLTEGARTKKGRERLFKDQFTRFDIPSLEARRLRWKRALNLSAVPVTMESHELVKINDPVIQSVTALQVVLPHVLL
ncbi:MAG: hypothetical protein Q9220_003101 [cf. Caloplaca sp. 1 TL-2023]